MLCLHVQCSIWAPLLCSSASLPVWGKMHALAWLYKTFVSCARIRMLEGICCICNFSCILVVFRSVGVLLWTLCVDHNCWWCLGGSSCQQYCEVNALLGKCDCGLLMHLIVTLVSILWRHEVRNCAVLVDNWKACMFQKFWTHYTSIIKQIILVITGSTLFNIT